MGATPFRSVSVANLWLFAMVGNIVWPNTEFVFRHRLLFRNIFFVAGSFCAPERHFVFGDLFLLRVVVLFWMCLFRIEVGSGWLLVRIVVASDRVLYPSVMLVGGCV